MALRVPSDQKLESKKKTIIEKLKIQQHPKSYTSNTSKEETVLEYVEDFRRQFVQVFPERAPLLLCPMNECGIRKFICTTLRPTQLPWQDMYNLENLSEFVSDFFEYLPLDNATQLPDLLPSPSTNIRARAGDCLDLANFLASLCRGSGFDAYVVSGYAPQWITMMDQGETEAPQLLDNPPEVDRQAMKKAANEKAEKDAEQELGRHIKYDNTEGAEKPEEEEEKLEEKKERYPMKVQPDHRSRYVLMLAREAREKKAKKVQEDLEKRSITQDIALDSLYGDRVHCWVLIKKGRRDVQEDMYVEPSSGRIYLVKTSPYLRVESVWNEQNYWANVQEVKPQEMQFDLSDSGAWEYVLIDDRKVEAKDEGMRDFESVNATEEKAKQLTPEETFDDRDILDCPMSWCSKIAIDRQMFRDRYPGGKKEILYQRCQVQKFSPYYEDAEGLVLKVVIYQTNDRISPIEIRETFKHREDKLRYRVTCPLQDRIHEFFDPGRPFGLKEFIQITGKRRVFVFYSKARVDGMILRSEEIGTKVVEEYEERDDFLVYRSIAVDQSASRNDPAVKKKAFNLNLGWGGDQPIRKITEKYARNKEIKHAENDVRKRTHFLQENLIRLDFQYGNHNITHSLEMVDKTDRQGTEPQPDPNRKSRSTATRVDPSWKPPTAGQKKEEHAKLLLREKELLSRVRDREAHFGKLMDKLLEETDKVVLEETIYDRAAKQSQKEDEKEAKEDSADHLDRNQVDYLSPFLAQYPQGKPLSRRQAMQAKDECLATLKERLLERANIIQAHLDDENQKLHQRRQVFKRQTGSGAVEADEDFTKFYEQAAFRIDILRTRLQRHEELALKKYVEMDERLDIDPRLAILQQEDDK